MDFIKRVNPKDINKLQLEGLVKSGAFDELEKIEVLYLSIPKIIQLNKIFNDEKISNQSSFLKTTAHNNENLILKYPKNGQKRTY